MSCVFGPVPSRRLGRSLGVDVVPFKTCTYDCIYCQLGRTTCKTVERKAWVPLEDVLDEVKEKLSTRPDYITLSGSGEPTLFSPLGDLIVGIKSMTGIPVALLTNGSLLWQADVREAIRDVDLLIPSLDAGDEAMFRRVNRPHGGLSFEQMLYCFALAGGYLLVISIILEFTCSKLQLNKYIPKEMLEESGVGWFVMNYIMEFLFYVAVPTIGYSFLYLVMPFDGPRAGIAAALLALVLGAVPVIIGLSVKVKISMPYLMYILLGYFLKLSGSVIIIGYLYSL